MRIALLVALVAALHARSADASCVSRTTLICAGTYGFAVASVVGGDETSTRVRVESLHRGQEEPAVGTEVVVTNSSPRPVGERWMLYGADGSFSFGARVEGNDAVLDDVHIPLADIEAFTDYMECDSTLRARGVTQPECNDTGGCTSTAAGALALAGLLLRPFRRRRSRA